MIDLTANVYIPEGDLSCKVSQDGDGVSRRQYVSTHDESKRSPLFAGVWTGSEVLIGSCCGSP